MALVLLWVEFLMESMLEYQCTYIYACTVFKLMHAAGMVQSDSLQ